MALKLDKSRYITTKKVSLSKLTQMLRNHLISLRNKAKKETVVGQNLKKSELPV